MDPKTGIIIEFITKTVGLAYQYPDPNPISSPCRFCGGGREYDKDIPDLWHPKHLPGCLYARAERLVALEGETRPEHCRKGEEEGTEGAEGREGMELRRFGDFWVDLNRLIAIRYHRCGGSDPYRSYWELTEREGPSWEIQRRIWSHDRAFYPFSNFVEAEICKGDSRFLIDVPEECGKGEEESMKSKKVAWKVVLAEGRIVVIEAEQVAVLDDGTLCLSDRTGPESLQALVSSTEWVFVERVSTDRCCSAVCEDSD